VRFSRHHRIYGQRRPDTTRPSRGTASFCTLRDGSRLGTPLDIDVGQVIAGKYELVRLLGKGAMGEVWLANHNSLGGQFAIKLVEPTDDAEAETAAGRFQLEAQIAAKLSRQTRHIVSVSDHGEEEGLAYLVMELLEGESLESRLKRTGPLALPEVAAIVSQIARALSLAHAEGIFHRDLKPANVWLGRDEDGRLLVKLLDFGIARSVKPFRTRSPFATSKDMVLGTPSYMSPEQARGLDTLDYRCDLWALAVVAYEALTTKIPFEGETVEDVFLSICTFRVVPILTRRADLPSEVDAFFKCAFASKVESRFPYAAELSEVFEQLVSAEELEAALGLPLTPASSRRLLEARRASRPEFAGDVMRQSRPDMGAPAGRGSRPDFALPPSTSPTLPDRGSVPAFENIAHGGPQPASRRGSGWLIALLALIALLGIGTFALVSFRGTGTSSATATQPSPPASSEPKPASPPATTADVPPPTPTALTSSAPPLAVEPKPTGRPKANGTANAKPPPQPPAPPPTTPATAAPPPPPSPTPAPTPAPAKSVNRSEVL
jgi:serine/threonine protein kinase